MNLATITYNDNVIKTLTDTDSSVILATKDKYVEKNITASIVVPEYDGTYFPPYLCFTANTAGSTVAMSIDGTPTLDQTFQYTTDGNWNTFTPGTTTITLANIGDKVYFKGNNPNGISESSSIYYKFVMSGSIAGSGNIMSLIDNGVCNTTTIPNDYCFYNLFNGCASLTTTPELPATILSDLCYAAMFSGCTLLTASPSLPAQNIKSGSYASMFFGCTSLTTAPKLPGTYFYTSTASNWYYNMFSNCTSLQVSDTQTTEAPYKWRIPTSGTTQIQDKTGSYVRTRIFANCAGTRSLDAIPIGGNMYTIVYTQNPPV